MGKEALKDLISPEMYEHLDTCAKQIWYWRTHLDVFIEQYLHIKLFDFQKVIARMVGNGDDLGLALSRGQGKTWLLATCAVAIALLWPDSPIISVSNTAPQANLLLEKIRDELLPNEDITREIDYGVGKGIKIRQNGRSAIFWKNGSRTQALVLGKEGTSILGQRGKMVVIDEAKLIPTSICNNAIGPVLNYKRPVFYQLRDQGFQDYNSKIINISSAYFSSCDFFGRFKNTLRKMATGDRGAFACALDFTCCIRTGMQDADYYERERARMSSVEFAMEYGSVFVGASDNTVFPYSLTEPCRVLDKVEITQPKGSESRYIIAADIAGDGNYDTADNSVIAVLKIVERQNGRWAKHLVWLGAYRGLSQRQIAEEIRTVYLRYPRTEAIVYDANAIGRGLESLFDQPWQYEDAKGNKVEMPPMLPYNSPASYKSIKILHPFIATNALNAQMVGILTRNFEDKELMLPIPSNTVENITLLPRLEDEDDTTEEAQEKRRRTMLLTEEAMVYKETDELQAELGNIVGRMSAQGNMVYGTAVSTQRKDRFSAVAMGMFLIDRMETTERRSDYASDDEDMPFVVSVM